MPGNIPERFYGKFRIIPKDDGRYTVQEKIDMFDLNLWHMWKDLTDWSYDYEVTRIFNTVGDARDAIDAEIKRQMAETKNTDKDVIYYP